MNLLPFGQLPPYRPRAFVPQAIDLGDWRQIAPLFDQLASRAPHCKSAAELERWLLDWSELNAALDEESSRRYIAMTCHTDDSEAEKAYLHFVENVEPQLKPRQFALEKIYVAHPQRVHLPQPRFEVFDRDLKNRVELFRPQNVPLEKEDAKLSQQYQKLSGSLTVNFRGEEKTLVQMSPFLEETDRALRQEAWELVAKRRLKEAEKFDDIYDRQIELRAQIAKNAGFENYRDYAFEKLGRFDYTPDDCKKFHDAVEEHVMPLVRELQAQRRSQLKIEALKPWDLAVDPLNRAPLKPFTEVSMMVARTQSIFNRLDKGLANDFQQLQDLNLLDLDNRKGKAPGGYEQTLSEARVPFIFMNAVGVQRDVETILHEAGHAFHALATRNEELHAYRSAPIEFCEVASMGMELLGYGFIEEFFPVKKPRKPRGAPKATPPPVPTGANEAKRARRVHLEGILGVFPWIATVDAFQHWVYTHPQPSRAERIVAWLKLMNRFGGEVDWSGCEAARARLWHRQLHIFLLPFYYIEYGFAELGALQLWAGSKTDRPKALENYKKALALGGSRPLPELFAAAGCQFDFSDVTFRPLMRVVREALEKLSG